MFVSNLPNLTLNPRTESLSSQSEIWLCHSPTCNPALAPYNLRIKSNFLSIMYGILPTNLTYDISSLILHQFSPMLTHYSHTNFSSKTRPRSLVFESLHMLFP